MSAKLRIRNGRVIDPFNNFDNVADVFIAHGVIESVRNRITSEHDDVPTLDATGLLVVPGLIDVHTHVYPYGTPLGIDPDEWCLCRGVTTVVDAGSTGAATFPGLKHYVIDRCKTRVLAFLHIANHGLASAGCAGHSPGGECDSLNQLQVEQCVRCIREHPQDIVGVKVRLAASVCDQGRNERAAFQRALDARTVAKVPLMVHHALSTVPLFSTHETGCLQNLSNGDLYTHCFHGYKGHIFDQTSDSTFTAVQEAQVRGVLFDVGHGFGSFSWDIAKRAAQHQFWPNTISTDLHTQSCDGPAYDLPAVMSKMHHLGMPLYDIIKSVTQAPAKAIGREQKLGNLNVGTVADITVLRLSQQPSQMEDSFGVTEVVQSCFEPVYVFKNGESISIRQQQRSLRKLSALKKNLLLN